MPADGGTSNNSAKDILTPGQPESILQRGGFIYSAPVEQWADISGVYSWDSGISHY